MYLLYFESCIDIALITELFPPINKAVRIYTLIRLMASELFSANSMHDLVSDYYSCNWTRRLTPSVLLSGLQHSVFLLTSRVYCVGSSLKLRKVTAGAINEVCTSFLSDCHENFANMICLQRHSRIELI